MQWLDFKAEHKENGQIFSVVKPAFVMEFYAQRPAMTDYGVALLERFLSLAPKGQAFYQLGNNAREYTPLTSQVLKRIQKTLALLKEKGRFYSIKSAPGFDAGEWSLEFSLGSKEGPINDVVYWTMPIDAASDKAIGNARELFAGMVADFPFWAGVAGYGFSLVWGREFEMTGMPAMMRTALRFRGLLIRDRLEEKQSVKMLKSAGWLTFLDREMLQKVGGRSIVEEMLDPRVKITSLRQGVLLQAGDRPPSGDVNIQDKDVAPMASVNRALTGIRIDQWTDASLYATSTETANGWLKRFD